ncbi:ergothioneine biosynthesis protein EgtB [Caenispirillum bisanense]|uniref:Ergothioneine biosynthesis protein EgtB n=1 Tax=Caenispirillum bisanense TaxID=414052 RepID=A0A286G8H7_9PROT|nr:ergothioneine biosynthesis protein EgtB [Caenispirillum bisanense]SOD91805.1 ergothioneine biosynthesis protein EgtB [Caenispirillum bisanense]
MPEAIRDAGPTHAGPAAEDRATEDRDVWRARWRAVRGFSEALAAPLSPEDMQVQSRTECSPTKWHLAHVTWFFETFILREVFPTRPPFRTDFPYLFNSYYEGAGPRQPRPQRGMITRPAVSEVMAWRAAVDAAMDGLIAHADDATWTGTVRPLLELGLSHEQQHQELVLMDLLDLFALHPSAPVYRAAEPPPAGEAAPLTWHRHPGGIVAVGHDAGGGGVAFDNEGPRHEVLLRPFRLARRCVTNGEWREFMVDGGYSRPDLWLMDGWAAAQREGWEAPRTWRRQGDGDDWRAFGLHGLQPLDPAAPVCHVSFYEADAYARWAGARLPTEEEWEVVAADLPVAGRFLNDPATDLLTPRPAPPAEAGDAPVQMFGDVWEWTASPYRPYPGYRPPAGTLGEYNGKFMSNQMVLRGGCCITPAGHLRATYRNFFYPHDRWAFSGLRLAEDD